MFCVLVVGSGGREHALVWHLAKHPDCTRIIICGSNAGIALEPKTTCVDCAVDDIQKIVGTATQHRVDLAIIGPELPLTLGVSDALIEAGIMVFGPSKNAARLEGEKTFSKDFLQRHGIATPRADIFDDPNKAIAALKQKTFPLVIKANGLAAGKGVRIVSDYDSGVSAITDLMVNTMFGESGSTILLEEYLEGYEVSAIAMVWDDLFITLEFAKDHKRLLEDDQGPNTGGMGVISPHPAITKELKNKIVTEVLDPSVAGLVSDGIPYRGFLYAGLMIAKNSISVLEFNCRLGDPEAQALLIRLQTSLPYIISELSLGKKPNISWSPLVSTCVVMATEGYPQHTKKNVAFKLPAKTSDNSVIFQAGTYVKDFVSIAGGGRALTVTALGENQKAASDAVYEIISKIEFTNSCWRGDIGKKNHLI